MKGSPEDYIWAPGPIPLHHLDAIGPHHAKGDTVRFWIETLATADKRLLELPEIYLDSRVVKHLTTWKMNRRASIIDDHADAYDWSTWQGPDLYVFLHVPSGRYTLSLYFINQYDYRVDLIFLPDSYPVTVDGQPNTAPLAEYNFRHTANARVVNPQEGVWKRFLIRGPTKLAVHVAKNYSLNATLFGAMLDPLAEHPAPYYCGEKEWKTKQAGQAKFRVAFVNWWRIGNLPRELPTLTGLDLAQRLLQMLDVLEYRDPAIWAANQQLAYTLLLRWCVAHYGLIPKDPTATYIAEKCYYELGLFKRWETVEKARGILTSRQIEKGLRWDRVSDSYRGLEFSTIRRYVQGLKRSHPASSVH